MITPEEILSYLLGICYWTLIYNIITKNSYIHETSKEDKNTVSFIHAMSVVVLYIINLYPTTFFMYFSISFYVMDLCVDLKMNINYSTIIHHISTIISLLYIKQYYFVYELLILMEISNIPMYIVYHRICSGQIVSKSYIYFEIAYYVSFRVLCGTYVIIYSFHHMDLLLKSIVFIIGVMSLYWTRKLFKQLATFE